MEPLTNTQKVTTPSGAHEVVLKAYITGADKRASRRKLLELTGGSFDEKEMVKQIDAAEDALIEQVVISVDGSTENVVTSLLAMKGDDYDFLITKVNGIANGLEGKKKATSDGSTPTTSTEEK